MNETISKVAEIQVSYHPKNSTKPIIRNSAEVFFHLLKFFPETTISLQERFVVGYLNRANRLIGVYEVSKGGITSTIVDIRLVISVALKVAATSILLAHNHPSGNIQPSEADKDITRKIKEACRLFDICVLDHMILVPGGMYFSFAEEGFI